MRRALYGIVAVFAQLRVDAIRENTMRNLEHARSHCRHVGRSTAMTSGRMEAAKHMREDYVSHGQICRVLGVGVSSVRRVLASESTSNTG